LKNKRCPFPTKAKHTHAHTYTDSKAQSQAGIYTHTYAYTQTRRTQRPTKWLVFRASIRVVRLAAGAELRFVLVPLSFFVSHESNVGREEHDDEDYGDTGDEKET